MMALNHIKYMVLCKLPYYGRKIINRFMNGFRRRRNESLASKLEDIRNLLIYNHPVSQVPPATGKLRLLQEGNTVLLALFARKCRENGLRYWLDYGTLLGAVRHRGFIPWDDDLDASMMRPEYDRLLELLPSLFPREEGFTWKRHAFLQIGYEGTPLNIDVYPYHFYSESLVSPEQHGSLDRRLTAFKKDVVLVDGRMNMTDDQIQQKIRREILEGKDPAAEEDTPGIFLSPAITFTKNTHLPYETFFPLGSMEFEGMKFSVPNHARQYLQFFYGDYLSYPDRIQFKHPSVKRMMEHVPFETAVNRFIDVYGKQIDISQS